MKDLGDWLFLIGMGGLAGGYYIYENKTDVAAWVNTVQAATEPTRIAGSSITDHWGMILLVIALVIVGIMLVGDSLNKRTATKETTTAAMTGQVRRPRYRNVIGKNKARKVK